MKLYLAGPMTGYPRWNFDAFELATALLRDKGHEVISPAEIDLARGFDPDAPAEQYTAADYTGAMRRDIEALLQVEGVALLPGWADSRGATLEAKIGEALGLHVQHLEFYLGREVFV